MSFIQSFVVYGFPVFPLTYQAWHMIAWQLAKMALCAIRENLLFRAYFQGKITVAKNLPYLLVWEIFKTKVHILFVCPLVGLAWHVVALFCAKVMAQSTIHFVGPLFHGQFQPINLDNCANFNTTLYHNKILQLSS